MKIWCVTSGDYSDYSVLGIFRTEGLAKSVAEALNDGSSYRFYDVSTIPLYLEMPVIVDELHIEGEVDPDNDAWSGKETHQRWIKGEGDHSALPCQHTVGVSASYMHNERRAVVHIHVWGDDHVRVRKTFSEQLAHARADALLLIAKSEAEAAQREAKYLRARVADLTSKQGYGTLGS